MATPALPERMATVERSDNSGKTEVAPAVCGETRIRPVGRTASMASMAHLGLTRRRGAGSANRAAADFNERCSDRRGTGRCKPLCERCVPH